MPQRTLATWTSRWPFASGFWLRCPMTTNIRENGECNGNEHGDNIETGFTYALIVAMSTNSTVQDRLYNQGMLNLQTGQVMPVGSSCPPPAIPYIFKFQHLGFEVWTRHTCTQQAPLAWQTTGQVLGFGVKFRLLGLSLEVWGQVHDFLG